MPDRERSSKAADEAAFTHRWVSAESVRRPWPRSWARALWAVLRTAYCYGSGRECPYCGSHLGRFLPAGDDQPVLRQMMVLGAGRRANALCPVCGSLDRDRLLHLYLRHQTSLFERPMRVLHVAPERPLQRILSRQAHLDYVTTDLFREDVQVRADLTSLPFPDDSFDAALCNHVFEYIPDDRKAMREVHRVLKPGGWAILQEEIALKLETTFEDPAARTRAERYAAYGEPDHWRLYALDYPRRLEDAGYRLNIFQWSSDIEHFGGAANRFGLLAGESVFHAIKPD